MPERDQHESIGKKIEGLLARAKGEEHTGASSPAGHVPATVPPHSHGGSSSPESKTAALDAGGSIDPSTQSGASPGLLAGSGILDAFGTTITIGATVKLVCTVVSFGTTITIGATVKLVCTVVSIDTTDAHFGTIKCKLQHVTSPAATGRHYGPTQSINYAPGDPQVLSNIFGFEAAELVVGS
jgi:hypothetical protein